MKKVYCKNCKYLEIIDTFLYGGYFRCHNPENLKSEINHPYVINKNNNCKFYKRKWWKFWVKEK